MAQRSDFKVSIPSPPLPDETAPWIVRQWRRLDSYLQDQATKPVVPLPAGAAQWKWQWRLLFVPIFVIINLIGVTIKWLLIAIAFCIPLFAIMYCVGYLLDVSGIGLGGVLYAAPVAAPLGFMLARLLTKNGTHWFATSLAYISAAAAALMLPLLLMGSMFGVMLVAQPLLGEKISQEIASKSGEGLLAILGALLVVKPLRWSLRKPPLFGHGKSPNPADPAGQ